MGKVYNEIKNGKDYEPMQWTRNTVADGKFLERYTLEKLRNSDLHLAECIDELSAAVDKGGGLNDFFYQGQEGQIVASKGGEAGLEWIDFDPVISGSDPIFINGYTTAQQITGTTATEISGFQIRQYSTPNNEISVNTEGNQRIHLKKGSYYINATVKIFIDTAHSQTLTTDLAQFTISLNDETGNAVGIQLKDLSTKNTETISINRVLVITADRDLSFTIQCDVNLTNGYTVEVTSIDIFAIARFQDSTNVCWYPTVSDAGIISWEQSETTTAPQEQNIKGPQGDPGADGEDGKTPELSAKDYHIKWKYTTDTDWTDLGDFRGAKGETGASGTSLAAYPDKVGKNTTVEIYDPVNDPTHDHPITSFVVSDGNDGTNGISGTSVSARVVEDHANKKSTVTLFDPYSSSEHIIQSFEVKDGNDGQGFIEASHYQSLSAGYADYARFSDNSVSSMDQIKGSIDWGNGIAQEYKTHSGDYVTSAGNLPQTAGKYGLVKDSQGNVSWGIISEGSTYNFDNDTQGYHTLSGDGSTHPIGVNTDLFYKKTETSGATELSTEFGKYVQKSGDQMTGTLELSGADFDNYYLNMIRENQPNNNVRIGVGTNGQAVIKSKVGNYYGQLTVSPNTNKNIPTINVQYAQQGEGDSRGLQLIPMKVHNGSYTPDSDDGILHIVVESN